MHCKNTNICVENIVVLGKVTKLVGPTKLAQTNNQGLVWHDSTCDTLPIMDG